MSTSYFYGVYLLCSKSVEKHYAGRCYIGYTVNPNRRIKQHNRGKDFGGAKRTNNKGPWEMVMIIHGFPNNISALQFEWAWQKPALSTRLKSYTDLRRKNRNESHFQYNFRVLSRMLNVGPWYRLPLTIRWLQSEYECDFDLKPPAYMKIVTGNIEIPTSQKATKTHDPDASPPRAIWAPECHLCMKRIEDPERSRIGCTNSLCKLTCHIICLANYILSTDESSRGHYIPITGECPLCESKFTWVDLIQRKRKLQENGVEQIEEDDDNEFNDDDVDVEDVDDDDVDDFNDGNFDFDDPDKSDGDDDVEIHFDDVHVDNDDVVEVDNYDFGDNRCQIENLIQDNDYKSYFSAMADTHNSDIYSKCSSDSKSDNDCMLTETAARKGEYVNDLLSFDDMVYELSD